ncbi:MAG: hypothetical protein SGBAC_011029 [Bacillariaceae sp.]
MNTIAMISRRAALMAAKRQSQIVVTRNIPRMRMLLSTKPFAVEAPDGPSDLELADNLDWDEHAVDYELMFGHAEEVKEGRKEAAKILAVDAPDGTTDAEMMDTAQWDEQAIEQEVKSGYAAHIKKDRAEAAKIFAVDAPDGTTSDLELKDNLDWDEYAVDYEVMFNHAKEIKEGRAAAAKIVAVDAPDGTTDAEMIATTQWDEEVIDHAAKHEDIAEVHRIHKRQEDILRQTINHSW